jgi:O-antigen ligase
LFEYGTLGGVFSPASHDYHLIPSNLMMYRRRETLVVRDARWWGTFGKEDRRDLTGIAGAMNERCGMSDGSTAVGVSRMRRPNALSPSLLTGIALGILLGAPIIGLVTGIGQLAYFLPLGILALSAGLRGATSPRLTLPGSVLAFGGLLVLFIVWMGFSSLWAAPTISTADDLVLLVGILVMALGFIVATDGRASDNAVSFAIFVALCVAAYVFWMYLSSGALRGYGALSANYPLIAQITGFGAVLAVVRAMTRDGSARRRDVALALVLLPALALSLARGALLGAILVTVVSAVYCHLTLGRFRIHRHFREWSRAVSGRLVAVTVVLGGIVLTLFSALRVERTRARLERLFSGRELTEGGRVQLWREAWHNISDAPLIGHGLGSSGIMSGTGQQLYPHNWALQVWLDGGIVGLVLCALALAAPPAYAVLRTRRKGRHLVRSWLPLAAGYVFILLEYSKSQNFYTSRLLFVLGVLVIRASHDRLGKASAPVRHAAEGTETS